MAGADVVVPVRLHKVRVRERALNQPELLSKRLAKRQKAAHQGVFAGAKEAAAGQNIC